MNKLQFSINIKARKQKVWDTLWQDQTFRQWANIIDEGTYMIGDFKEGSEIQFISAVNGYGVTSFIQKLTPTEFLLIKHSADTQDKGQNERDKQWTGGEESYSLSEKDGVTTLIATFDVPDELIDYFNEAYPKAFEKVKELAENQY